MAYRLQVPLETAGLKTQSTLSHVNCVTNLIQVELCNPFVSGCQDIVVITTKSWRHTPMLVNLKMITLQVSSWSLNITQLISINIFDLQILKNCSPSSLEKKEHLYIHRCKTLYPVGLNKNNHSGLSILTQIFCIRIFLLRLQGHIL